MNKYTLVGLVALYAMTSCFVTGSEEDAKKGHAGARVFRSTTSRENNKLHDAEKKALGKVVMASGEAYMTAVFKFEKTLKKIDLDTKGPLSDLPNMMKKAHIFGLFSINLTDEQQKYMKDYDELSKDFEEVNTMGIKCGVLWKKFEDYILSDK